MQGGAGDRDYCPHKIGKSIPTFHRPFVRLLGVSFKAASDSTSAGTAIIGASCHWLHEVTIRYKLTKTQVFQTLAPSMACSVSVTGKQ
jgi:hypothetical protein